MTRAHWISILTAAALLLPLTAMAQRVTCNNAKTASGFTLTCSQGEGDPDFDISVSGVSRYDAYTSDTDWLKFTLQANRNVPSFEFTITFNFPDGTKQIEKENVFGGLFADEVEAATVIPDDAGSNWTSVEILAPGTISCDGCGTYTSASIMTTNAIDPSSISMDDLGAVFREIQRSAR